MDNLIELRSLRKSFGSVTALDDVCLTIPPGRIVGLLGPNGSGKTTTLKLLCGLLQPTSGEVLINGTAPSPETKAIVSYLPERTYLQGWMKVKDVAAFFEDFYADFDLGRAMEMFYELGVDANRKLSTLSKGTKEKVQLILVMSRRAKLYLLDEPIGGVDPAARDYIIKTILQNYSRDASILISTHLIRDVEDIFDDVVFLQNGHVLLYDSAAAVREKKGVSIDELFREVFKC